MDFVTLKYTFNNLKFVSFKINDIQVAFNDIRDENIIEKNKELRQCNP